MSPKWNTVAAIALTAITMLALAACAKHPVHETDAVTAPAPAAARPPASAPPHATIGPSPTGVLATPRAVPATPAPAGAPPPSAFHAIAELGDIHFDFDRYDIRPEERVALEANVRWLRLHPGTLVLIEGHCDPRGTTVYNLSLGDRRAKAIVTHLLTQGVLASRIATISYGEERPLCDAANESCWASDRRAHCLVKDQ